MPYNELFIFFGTGLAIGLISGLVGIGGGIIMTPVQYWIYTSAGMSPDIAIKISIATSLAVVLPTAISGVIRHHRLGNINWKAAVFMGIFTALASFLGASIAAHVPGAALKLIFGSIVILVAIRMLTVKVCDEDRPVKENRWLWTGIALGIGLLSGITGVGGGIFIVPALVLILGFRTHKAAATSLAMVVFTSIGGIAGYIVNGRNVPNLPDHTIGYLYWPAWIALTAGSVGMAQVGAAIAHKVPARMLNFMLTILLAYIGLDMLGAMGWIASKL
jgi:uncharacterized membrane protein YfcA